MTIYRRRAATCLVAFYVLCILSPYASAAFIDAGKALHCLVQVTQQYAHQHGQAVHEEHVHSLVGDETDPSVLHTTSSDDESGAQRGTSEQSGKPLACCGLFFTSGLAADVRSLDLASEPATIQPTRVLNDHFGPRLYQISRPPIA